MNEYTYDLHTHSCLSPCGSDDMTPSNMAAMAELAGCDILAITDHNSCKNAPALMKAGQRQELLVIPGMELCVSEEAHIVCLFETLSGAMAFDEFIYGHMPHVRNKSEIFGEQRICDEKDEIIGMEENLLLIAASVSSWDIVKLTAEYGGIAFPAHVNRDSFSILTSLGAIPRENGFLAAEITYNCDVGGILKKEPYLSELLILQNSDAHYLEALAGEKKTMELPEKSIRAVLEHIRQGKCHDC